MLVLGNLVICLFIDYSLFGVAEVASKLDAKYQFVGFGHLVLHHFVHDFEFCRDLQVAIWFAETQVIKVLTHSVEVQ